MPNLKTPIGAVAADPSDSKVLNLSRDAGLSRDELLRALHEYKTRFDDLVEGSLQGVMVTLGPRPVFANAALANMFGYSVDDIVALGSWEQLVAPADRERVLAICRERSVGGEAPSHYEYQAIRKDGSLFWLENLSRVVTWSGEAAVQSTVIDVTERKVFEDNLIAASTAADNANRAKSEFLATMTHEFRTPLNAILGFSDLLRSEIPGFPAGPQIKEYANDIHNSGRHMLSLVNDVLDIAAIESGKREISLSPVAIAEVLSESVKFIELMAHAKDVDIILNVPEPSPVLPADERSCMQIFHNILSNAVKFTAAGGVLHVSAEIHGDVFVCTFEDTGCGIPADMIDSITEPFVQAHTDPHLAENSTGLGLGIVKSLIEEHGGTLQIESEAGKGTKVTVTFPT